VFTKSVSSAAVGSAELLHPASAPSTSRASIEHLGPGMVGKGRSWLWSSQPLRRARRSGNSAGFCSAFSGGMASAADICDDAAGSCGIELARRHGYYGLSQHLR
jgi:hypothetical protein